MKSKTFRYVKRDLDVGSQYNGETFMEEMAKFRGKQVMIVRETKNPLTGYAEYNIADDEEGWFWTDAMFEEE